MGVGNFWVSDFEKSSFQNLKYRIFCNIKMILWCKTEKPLIWKWVAHDNVYQGLENMSYSCQLIYSRSEAFPNNNFLFDTKSDNIFDWLYRCQGGIDKDNMITSPNSNIYSKPVGLGRNTNKNRPIMLYLSIKNLFIFC